MYDVYINSDRRTYQNVGGLGIVARFSVKKNRAERGFELPTSSFVQQIPTTGPHE